MASTNSAPVEANKDIQDDDSIDMDLLISSLPKEKGWIFEVIYKYKGFWFDKPFLQGLIMAQQLTLSNAKSHHIVLATFPKAGTTWFCALLFTLVNRTIYDFSTHPLLTSSPHECVSGIEYYALKKPLKLTIPNTCSILESHIPYTLLPEFTKSSSFCPIVYVCRDPGDLFVSYWHFANKLRDKELPPLGLQEAFDLFCQGVAPFGSYWDHVLGYWYASLEMPNKVLFMRYEEMKSNPFVNIKKLANFVSYPFTTQEESDGMIEKIVEFCSFERLTSLKVNQEEHKKKHVVGTNVSNNMFFRKGVVGDHKNYLSDDMIKHLKLITKMKFKGSGLQFY